MDAQVTTIAKMVVNSFEIENSTIVLMCDIRNRVIKERNYLHNVCTDIPIGCPLEK